MLVSGTPWWGTLLATLVTGLAALGGTALATWRQNRRAGREEWFRRVQWAQQLTADENDGSRAAGYRVLEQLARSRLADADDLELLTQLARNSAIDDAVIVEDNATDSLDDRVTLRDTDWEPSEEAP